MVGSPTANAVGFCKSFSNIPSLTVGVRQMAAFISIQTNPDREGMLRKSVKPIFHPVRVLALSRRPSAFTQALDDQRTRHTGAAFDGAVVDHFHFAALRRNVEREFDRFTLHRAG